MSMDDVKDPDVYHEIVDAAPDAMIVVDHEGRIRFANTQAERLFGHARAALERLALDDLIPARFRHAHVAHVGRFFAHPATRSMGSGLELFAQRHDGSELPVEVSLSPVGSSAQPLTCAAIRDITQRKRVEAAARINAARLESAIESLQDALALFDAEDRLVLCNAAFRQLVTGSASGALAGKPYEEVLDLWLPELEFAGDDERARFRAERLAGRRDPQGAFDVCTRDGRSLRVADRRTAEGGIVKTVWDLTEDMRLSAELREARSPAERASAAKTEFLSSVSHELRTPLNAILGFAQLLRRDKREPLSTRHLERVEQILSGGEHLLRLIDDVLDLSRIEAGRVSISTEAVNVAEVLAEIERTLEPSAARASVRLHVEPPPPGLPEVSADRTRFAQIVMNFVSNAIKYNRPGGSVTMSSSAPSSRTIRVMVADTGIGVPEDKQGALFQPFQRAGQETGPIEGTGIGLVICKRLAQIMAGDVGFRSREGTGSEFWVDLPVRAEAPAAHGKGRSDSGASGRLGDVHGRRVVLYVEDNQANVLFMRDVLRDFEGIELLVAPTAEMAIELARSRVPDVVIMDINLPGMNGFEALAALRARPSTSGVPAIALSAAASERDRRRGAEAGFYRYLTKPVRVDELLETLSPFLSTNTPHG